MIFHAIFVCGFNCQPQINIVNVEPHNGHCTSITVLLTAINASSFSIISAIQLLKLSTGWCSTASPMCPVPCNQMKSRQWSPFSVCFSGCSIRYIGRSCSCPAYVFVIYTLYIGRFVHTSSLLSTHYQIQYWGFCISQQLRVQEGIAFLFQLEMKDRLRLHWSASM